MVILVCSHHFSTPRPDFVAQGDVVGKTFTILRGQQPIAEVKYVINMSNFSAQRQFAVLAILASLSYSKYHPISLGILICSWADKP